MKAMILAAGRGERLLPLTAATPKPLIEVGGETLIERHLAALARAGVTEVVVNISHLGDLIEARLGDGRRYGVDIVYSREPGEPLETAGGILAALPLLGGAPFIVLNADIWTDYPLAQLPTDTVRAHLVLVPNPPHHPQGDFDLVAGRLKRKLTNSGTYSGIGVFNPDFFAGLESGKRALAPLLFDAAAINALSGECYRGRWFDIGTPERLATVRQAVAGAA